MSRQSDVQDSIGNALGYNWAAEVPLRATIVDRMGNQHQVNKLTYQTDRDRFSSMSSRAPQLADIARLRLAGERRTRYRSPGLAYGARRPARIFTGGSGIVLIRMGSGQVSNS
jgi:hypothetical protein